MTKFPGWLKFIIEAIVGILKSKGYIDPNAQKKPNPIEPNPIEDIKK